jgi:hypothetical protein
MFHFKPNRIWTKLEQVLIFQGHLHTFLCIWGKKLLFSLYFYNWVNFKTFMESIFSLVNWRHTYVIILITLINLYLLMLWIGTFVCNSISVSSPSTVDLPQPVATQSEYDDNSYITKNKSNRVKHNKKLIEFKKNKVFRGSARRLSIYSFAWDFSKAQRQIKKKSSKTWQKKASN